jgi:hypothetical protein
MSRQTPTIRIAVTRLVTPTEGQSYVTNQGQSVSVLLSGTHLMLMNRFLLLPDIVEGGTLFEERAGL